MKIRTQFIINLILLVGILVVVSVAVAITNLWIETTRQQQELASQVEVAAYKLDYLANDYLLYQERQQADRWESQFASFSENLSRMQGYTPEQRALLADIESNRQRLKAVFEDVKARIEDDSQTSGNEPDPKFLQMSWSRLDVQNQEMSFDASRLEGLLGEQQHRLEQQARLISLGLIGMLAIFILVNYGLTFRHILRAIAGLQAGTRIIGSGDLDFAIDVKNEDEIGELSRAFNQMTAQLKASMASRAELEREITERRQVEEALRASEYRFRSFIENAPVAISLGRNGRLIYANPMYVRMYGFDNIDELLGQPTEDRVAPQHRAQSIERSQRRAKGLPTENQYELIGLRKDGTEFPLFASIAPLNLADGPANIGFFQDITERKLAEQALRESEEKYRLISENANDWMYWIDTNRKFRYISSSCERLTGFTPAEFFNDFRLFIDIIHPEDRAQVEPHLNEIREGGETHHLDYRILTKTNELRWISHSCKAVYAEDGRYMGRSGTNRDITERKQAEDELRTAYQRFHIILSSLYGGILLVNNDNQIEFANPAFCDLFHLSDEPEDLLGLSASEMIQKISQTYAEPAAAVARIQEIVDHGQPVRGEELGMAGDRTYIRDFIPILFDGNWYGRMWNHIDITERKHAEQALRQSEENFSKAFLSSPAALLITRLADGCFLELNEAYSAIVGYERKELLGRRTKDFNIYIDPADRQAIVEQLQCQGSVRNFETSIRHRSGVIRHVIASQELLTFNHEACILTHLLDITGRKQVEQALRESENKFSTLFGKGAIPAALTRLSDHVFVDVNEAWLQLFGFEREEVIGNTSVGIGVNREVQQRAGIICEVQQLIPIHDLEQILFTKSGEPLTILTNVNLITIDGQDYAITSLQDISERKRAEDKVAYQAWLLENVNDAIVASDAQLRVTSWNAAAENMYGWKAEEVLGKNGSEYLRSELPHQDAAERKRQILETGYWRGEATHLRKDGSRIPVEVSSMALRDENGQISGFVSVNRDITERKQAEEALRADEERYRVVVDTALDAIIVSDPTGPGTILAANPAACQVFGYEMDEMIGLTREDILDIGDPNLTTLLEKRERLGRATSELIYKRKDGTRFSGDLSASFYQDQNGDRRSVSIIRDVTERKRSLEELNSLAEELRRSNAELEQFAYVASHDLQEPLRMVSSYVQLIARRYQGRLDENADEFIGYAVDGAKRMQNLINDLLTFSRVGTRGTPLLPTSCEEVLTGAISYLQIAIEESGAEITHEPLPLVIGDATQLVQLFQNLLSNAIKFRAVEPPRIHVGVEQQAEEWLFRVCDNGIGLDPKFEERIFVIFQRLHQRDAYPGTGIGLAICKRIVQRHGGRIWVESQPGQGATFYFTLPIKETE